MDSTDEHAVTAPMWRGVVLFRVVALVAVVVNLLRLLDGYRRPGLAVAVVAVIALWTVVVAVVYLGGDARWCRWTAIAELVVVPPATLTTLLVDDPARVAAGGPVLTTVWSAGPVLALAVAAGWRGGLVASAVTVLTLGAVRQVADASFFYDTQLLLVAGLAVGLAADWMRAAARRMQEAVAVRAATAERERLARGIHDEVLQVLAFVRRRGEEVARTEPDGSAAEIARLAGEQEVALRRLVATGPPPAPASGPAPDPEAGGGTDLCAALAAVVPTRASLAVPADPVVLDPRVAEALVAVVREAVANTERHAGGDAGLWVLVEDGGDDDEVTLSVRDDGAGIPAGRLAAAEAEGRLGVASSMRGRVADLGGRITLHTGEGEGTEWEVTLPRSVRSRDHATVPRSMRSMRSRGTG